MRILLLTLCNVCPGFIRMAATMYYVTWVMGQSTHFATLFISLGVVGMMIGSMLAKVLTDRWCKLQVFFWTNIVLAVFSCAFYFFNPHATTLIMVLYFLLNILHQIPSPLHWSLMSDVDDYGEWKTGKRITGISFSGNLFFLKVGLAVAGAMVGFVVMVRLRRRRESAKRLRAERYRAAILSHSRRRLSDHRRRGAPAEG